MGFFSWITSDTKRSISNMYSCRGTFPVYVLIPEEFGGGYIEEKSYQGYGNFGGRDIYALVAQWNKPELCKNKDGSWKSDEDCRSIGISIACYDQDNQKLHYPIKITEYPTKYEAATVSVGCPEQGYFYEEGEVME